MLEPNKLAEIESRSGEFMSAEASKPFGWDAAHFVERATITEMLHGVALPEGARIADLGCGSGWTTLFLAEAWVRRGRPRPGRRQRRAGRRTGRALGFLGALRDRRPRGARTAGRAVRRRAAVRGAAPLPAPGRGSRRRRRPAAPRRLAAARRADVAAPHLAGRAPGAAPARWLERGIGLRGLRRDLRAAGFGELRRFFGPTRLYEGRIGGFAWQLARLLAANVAVAPQAHLCVAARRA